MDELDLARRAVRRDLLTGEQLREAQSYAAGGRSLLSVLLDLGYLRPQDVGELAAQRPATAAPARSRVKTLFLLGATILLTALVTRGCTETVHDGMQVNRVVHEFVPKSEATDDQMFWVEVSFRATETLKAAGEQRKRAGLLSAETERDIRHAAELLAEAVARCPEAAPFVALARAHEMLDHWESAAEWYRKGLAREKYNDTANLGLASVLLALDRPLQAHQHATAACTGEFAAEAFLVRAKADMNLGNKEEARAELDLALQKDPALHDQVRSLQLRLDE